MIIATPDCLSLASRRFVRTTVVLLLLGALSDPAGAEPTFGVRAYGPAQAGHLRFVQAASPEVTFWESVRDSKDPAEIEAYLKAYPNGKFAPLARIRIKKLKGAAAPGNEKSESAAKPAAAKLGRQTLSVKVGESAGSKRGVLGVRIASLTSETAKGLGLANAKGAFVTEVLRNSAAELAGIKPLDVIVEFDGRPISEWRALPRIVGGTPPGTETRLAVTRFAKSFAELSERLRKRADSDPRAANSLGWLYAVAAGTAKDVTKAAHWYRKAADKGLPEAMTRLGSMYANGQGVAKDEAEAVKWYRKAADKNDAEALYNLGVTYEVGRGVSHDASEAARLYRKAADQGQSNAMFKLGTLYASGRGVSKDDAEAVIWYRKAAEFDQPDAIANLGLMYETGHGVFSDDAQAVRLYRKAAELGQVAAMHMLANMYAHGHGVAKDDAVAIKWYRRAANLGYAFAMNSLGWMYENGRGVAKDEAEAVRWYRKSAEKGNAAAMYNLGVAYENGRGVAKDDAEAVSWYAKAAKKGNSDSMHNLGAAYDAGRGTRKDPRVAAEWIFKAVKAGNKFSIKQMNENATAYTKQFRREFQKLLRGAGVYDGSIDGEFGPSTKAAVKALSKSPASGVTSGSTPAASANGTFEYDTDRPGSDYRSFDVDAADPALCAAQCRKETRCKAWTYVKPGVQGSAARCWLKDRVPDPVTANFAVSGVRGDTQ